jgi:hypothetical protein
VGVKKYRYLDHPRCSGYRGSFPEKKRLERDDDSSSPISEIENQYRYATTPALSLHLTCGINLPLFYYDKRRGKFREIVICEVKCRGRNTER